MVNDAADIDHLFWWFIGVILLTGALLLSARMGIYQEYLTGKYGKHPEEALFYTVSINATFMCVVYSIYFIAFIITTRLPRVL